MGFRIETQEPLTRRETKVEMNTQHLGQLNQVQQFGVRTVRRAGGRRDRGWDAADGSDCVVRGAMERSVRAQPSRPPYTEDAFLGLTL